MVKGTNGQDVLDAASGHEDIGQGGERAPGKVTALGLFLIFSRIGLTSFGGGLSGWFLREFVHDRHWLSEDEFLNGLALSQALPGVNVKNLAIWIGYRLLGWRGALAGFCGIIFPPAILIVLLGAFFSAIAYLPLTHTALAGAAAGAIGLSAAMAITAARRLPRRAFFVSHADRDLRGGGVIQGVARVDRVDSRRPERRLRIRPFAAAAITTVGQLSESHITCPEISSHCFRFSRRFRS